MSKRKAEPITAARAGASTGCRTAAASRCSKARRVGDGVVTADLETVLAALEGFDPGDAVEEGPRPGPADDAPRPAAAGAGARARPGDAAARDPRRIRDRHRAGDHVRLDDAARALAGRPGDARRGGAREPSARPPAAAARPTSSTTTSATSRSRSSRPAAGSPRRCCSCRTVSSASSAARERLLLAPMRDILIALAGRRRPRVRRVARGRSGRRWTRTTSISGGFRLPAGVVTPEPIDEALARA